MDPEFQSFTGSASSCFSTGVGTLCNFKTLGLSAFIGANMGLMSGASNQALLVHEVQSKALFAKKVNDLDHLYRDLEKLGYKGKKLQEVKAIIDDIKKTTHPSRPIAGADTTRMIESLTNPNRLAVIGRALAGATIATAAMGAAEIAFRAGIAAIDFRMCKSKLGFASESHHPEEMDLYRQYVTLLDNCKIEINDEHFQKLKNLGHEKMSEIFEKSPALCKAYEEQGLKFHRAVVASVPDFREEDISCGPDSAIVTYKIEGKEQKAYFKREGKTLSVQGSFIRSKLSSKYDESRFRVRLKEDLSWSGIETPNRIWNMSPGTVVFSQDPASLKKYYKDNLETCSKAQISGDELYSNVSFLKQRCVVAETLIAADQLIGPTLKKCAAFGSDLAPSSSPKEAAKAK